MSIEIQVPYHLWDIGDTVEEITDMFNSILDELPVTQRQNIKKRFEEKKAWRIAQRVGVATAPTTED